MLKVSVCVPCKNPNMDYLKQCFQSVRDQWFEPFEVLVLDNNSSIDMVPKIQDLCKHYGFIYHREEKDGIGFARKRLSELSKGDYIAYLSADDCWKPHFLKKLVETAEKNINSVVYCSYEVMNEEGIVNRKFDAPNFADHLDFCVSCLEQAKNNTMFVCFDCVLIPKLVFETYNFDESLRQSEDLDFLLNTMLYFPYVGISERLAVYRNHSQSTTNLSYKNIVHVNEGILEKFFKNVKELNQKLLGQKIKKDVLLVNWTDFNEKIKGGVPTVFKNFHTVLSKCFNVRQVSFGQALECIYPNVLIDDDIHDEFKKAFIIDKYLENYLDLYSPLIYVLVRNAGCGGLIDHSQRVKIVNVFNDPYSSLFKQVRDSGYCGRSSDFWRFEKFAVMLQQMCGLQGFNVAVSDFMKQDMWDNGIKCDLVLLNCVDWEFWKPMINKVFKNPKPERFKKVGLWVGSPHIVKNYHNFARLVRDFGDVYWIIVFKGQFKYYDRFRQDNICVYDNISSELMRALYNSCDFVVCPSLVESFNLVALEAALMNKPVITTRTGLYWNDSYWSDKLGFRLNYWDDIKGLKILVNEIIHMENKCFSPREHITQFKELSFEEWSKKIESFL